ncbi:hypothetical protein JCM10213_007340 [Rhodosporidiobolus nylandii]
MPADRGHPSPLTAPSPAASQAGQAGQALKAQSLGRGRACRSCRKRKIKCDGRLPLCSPCEAAAVRNGQDVSTVHCDWDTEEERRKPVGGGKVAALEAKIVALERRIVELSGEQSAQQQQTAPSPSTPGPQYSPSPSTSTLPPFQPIQPPSFQPQQSGYTQLPPPPPPAQSSFHTLAAAATHYASSTFPPPFPPPPSAASTSAYPYQHHDAASTSPYPYPHSQQLEPPPPACVFDLPPPISASPAQHPRMPAPLPPLQMYPQQPIATSPVGETARLPSWPTLTRLVSTFFDYPHEAVDLINRKRFMAAFDLGPSHPDFPAQALLHAMVATAADLLGEEAAFEGEARYWPEGAKAALFHADYADSLLPLAFRQEKNMLQVAQAAVLFAATNLAHGRFARTFLETSSAVRICVALGLNHNGTDQYLPLSSMMSQRTVLPLPTDAEELHERAAVFWFAYTVEIFTGAATGWAICIDERDITTLIPSAAAATPECPQLDPVAREALYLHSPTFFTTNPPDLVRLVQINLKAVVLMNRVVTFVHRTMALANATPEKGPLTAADFVKIRASPAFSKLEAALDAFRRRAPNQLIALLEPQAFLLPALTGASIILLHECFVTADADCPSRAKCLEAANVMLHNMEVLSSAAFHPRHIPPFLSFNFMVAGRAFIRELALRKKSGNATAEELEHLATTVRKFVGIMSQSRTPLGAKSASVLVVLLDNPELALPPAEAVGSPPPLAKLIEAMEKDSGLMSQDICS